MRCRMIGNRALAPAASRVCSPSTPSRGAGAALGRGVPGGDDHPGPALSSRSRHHARAGAVALESGLVGRISGAAVLSARLRLARRAHPLTVGRRASSRGRDLPDPRLARLPAAGRGGLRAAAPRARRSGWLALPGAFVALTLSAGCRSGMEEGLALGPDRGPRWAGASCRCWRSACCAGSRAPRARRSRARLLVAAVILLHPAHAAGRRGAGGAGGRSLGAAVARLGARPRSSSRSGSGWPRSGSCRCWRTCRMALPLAWADATLPALGRRLGSQPLLLALALLSRGGVALARAAPSAAAAPLAAGAGAGPARRDRARRARRGAARRGLASRRPAGGRAACSRSCWAAPPRFAALVRAGARATRTVWAAAGSRWLGLCRAAGLGPATSPGSRCGRGRASWPTASRRSCAAPDGRALGRARVTRRPGACSSCAPRCRSTGAATGGGRTPTSPRSPRCVPGRAIVGGTFTHPSPVAGLVYYRLGGSPRPSRCWPSSATAQSVFGRALEALPAGEFIASGPAPAGRPRSWRWRRTCGGSAS